jgi:hypothetical protein
MGLGVAWMVFIFNELRISGLPSIVSGTGSAVGENDRNDRVKTISWQFSTSDAYPG